MNNWWKAGLLGAAGLGAMALTGGAAAPLLGAAGEGAAAGAGAAGAGEAAAAGIGAASTAAPDAAAFVTPSLFSGAPASGMLAGTSLDYGTPAMLAEANAAAASAPTPGLLSQVGGYASQAGKAASAYGTVNNAMGAGQPAARPAPAPQPIFQGQAPQIAPGMRAPQTNQFAQMMMAQRQRGLLG